MDDSSPPGNESTPSSQDLIRLKTTSAPRRNRTYLDAFEPATGKAVASSVAVTYERASALMRAGRGKVMEITSTVAETLRWPVAVFSGIRCDDDERGSDTVGWRCYVGRPKTYLTSDGRTFPSDPGDVFVVFVNGDGIAYNWRWEAASPDNPRLPRDHASRFRTRDYFEITSA